MGNYDDLINVHHIISDSRPRMPVSDRAAQFGSFAALAGFEAAIAETARLTTVKKELSENQREELDRFFAEAAERLDEKNRISVTYYKPDETKSGGCYTEYTGVVKKIDWVYRKIVFYGGTEIPTDDICGASFDEFDG